MTQPTPRLDPNAPLNPNFIYRWSERYRLFGLGDTILKQKIKTGEIPKPITLTEGKRPAKGWLGRQILEYHEKLLAAAQEGDKP